ncbi:MAG: hypothetical protein IKN74_02175 [Clostridia bacterium]|nr:hypothetical protein [Clostridia bacterium]
MENEDLYKKSIILIGPSGAGKSSVAEELSKITRMPRLCLDGIANRERSNGFRNRFRSSQEYNAFMIRRAIDDAKRHGTPGIVDFGAGHSIYNDPKIFADVKKMMADFKNVVLLLPSADPNESLRIMNERSTGDTRDNKYFLNSPCNRELATMTIYGNGRSPREIAESILKYIETRDSKTEEKINE